MIRWLIGVLAALAMMWSTAVAGGLDIDEGQWEITVETELEGMPMKMPAVTQTQCLTRESPVPSQNQPGQQCEIKDLKISGNTVTWSLICNTQGGRMTGAGKVTYTRTSMSGTMTLTGGPVNMVNRMSGRRIGKCP